MGNHKVSSKTKRIILGRKILYLGLWAGMLNNYCHICNQSPPICLIAKFCAKIRILKFGTENALFRWFGQQFWKAILIFSINAPEFALFQSLVQKVKIIKFGTKNVWFPYFETGIWKYYCHIWNQHPRISLVVMFDSKKKIPKFGKKLPIRGYFWKGIWK